MDASGHRHGQANPGHLHQQGDGLQGVPHDERSLGIAARLLVQAFDRRHFAAFLGALETIGQHDRTALDPHQAAAEQLLLEGLPPQLGQTVQIQRRRMEEMEQTVIAGVGKSEAADQAGDAGQVGAQAQSRQDGHQPQEGSGAGAGGAEGLEGAQPGQPEEGERLGKARSLKRLCMSVSIYMLSEHEAYSRH